VVFGEVGNFVML